MYFQRVREEVVRNVGRRGKPASGAYAHLTEHRMVCWGRLRTENSILQTEIRF